MTHLTHDTTAQNLVGTKTRTNKPWLSHETTVILEQKSAAKVRGDQMERKRLQSVFRAKAKADRETYLTRILDDVEEGFTHNRMGPAFKAIKQIAGTKTVQSAPTINKANGSPCDSSDEAALNHLPGTHSAEFVKSCINVIIITLLYTNCTRGLAKTNLSYT